MENIPSSPRPLDGITVLSLEQAVSAPFATRQLADLGARVIKIERPIVGDFARNYDTRVNGLASYFVWLNRSKESLTLDVKHPEAKNILAKLLEKSDVLVQNLAPGAAARLGLSEQALRPFHPRLILCEISGYGDDGPYRDKKAYDMMLQAEAGLIAATGTPEAQARPGLSVADISAGMYAYSSVLAALLLRSRTGEGSRIDVSMLETMTEWMSNPLYYSFAGASVPARSGAFHPSVQPYGPFRAGDGREVMLGVQNEREWAVFCAEVLARPELAADARFDTNVKRAAHRTELLASIESAFASLTADEIIARLDKAGIATASVNSVDRLWQHPQLRARGRWREIGSPAGPLPALLPPGRSGSFDYRMDAVPGIGEHTERILAELGYSAGEVGRLRAAGAI
jgi:itaconate CoA-transferase